MDATQSVFVFTYELADCVIHFRTGEVTQPCYAVMAFSLEGAVDRLVGDDPFGINNTQRYRDYVENGGIDYNITNKVHE